MHGIDALEFCCLLYLESRGAESSVTSLLESIFDNRLNDYFDDHLGSFTDNNYFVLAVNRMRLVNILKTKVDLNRIDKYRRECLMPLIKA